MNIPFKTALQLAIKNSGKPIISKFEIFYLASIIDQNQSYQGQPIRVQKLNFGSRKVAGVITQLIKNRSIINDLDFPHSHFRVLDKNITTASETCCLVDPFCYISHLTAMRKYGITNRIPEITMLTRPATKIWRDLKEDFEEKYLGKNLQNIEYFNLKRSKFSGVIREMKIQTIETKFPHPTMQIRDSWDRIAKIGYVFLDMLDKPELCGGMNHVIEVWQEYAENYLDEIIEAVDGCQKKIIKSRAGYIINEVLKIQNKHVLEWLKHSQRGGSRLLDPTRPFVPKFSQKWMLSINV